jgi:hypothetical protein
MGVPLYNRARDVLKHVGLGGALHRLETKGSAISHTELKIGIN